MKKLLSIILFTTILNMSFAKDILSGKTFTSSEGGKYEFTDDGKMLINFNDTPWCEFKYKIDEKKNNLTLSISKITYEAFGLNIGSYTQDKELHSLKEIKKILESADYINEVKFYLLGIPEQFKNYINLDDENLQQELYNVVCFVEVCNANEDPQSLSYDPKEDYSIKLAEIKKQTEEQRVHTELFIKNVIVTRMENINAQVAASSILLSHQNVPSYYDYEFDGKTLSLNESKKLIPVSSIFYASEYGDSDEKNGESFVFGSSIIATIKDNSSKFYFPQKFGKKDKGNLTFINMADKKDTITLKYNISREENVIVDAEILSGKYQGKKFQFTPALENMTLTLGEGNENN